jgi:O-antigen ligase
MTTTSLKTPWSLSSAQYCILLTAFFLPLSISLATITFYLSLICLLVHIPRTSLMHIGTNNPISLPLAGLALLFIGGLFLTPQTSNMTQSWPWSMLFKHGSLLSLPLLMTFFKEQPHYQNQCITLFILSCLVVVASACAWQLHCPWFFSAKHATPYFFISQIFTAIFICLASFIALIKTAQSTTPKQRLMYSCLWLALTASLFFQSPSRTGYIIFMIITPMLIWQHYLRHNLSLKKLGCLLGGSILLLGMLINAPMFQKRSQHIWQDLTFFQQQNHAHFFNHTSTGIRVQENIEAFQLISKKPWLGYGTGGYLLTHAANSKQHYASLGAMKKNTENSFWTLTIEHGLIGLGLFLYILAILWQRPLSKQLNLPGLNRAFLLTFILSSFSQDMLSDDVPRMFVLLFIALLFANSHPQKKLPADRP